MQLDTIRDLLIAIDALPETDRERARRRIEAALEQPAPAARAALGLIALDLAGVYREALRSDGVADHVIILPDLRPAAGRVYADADHAVSASA
jgi:hypothetical protein